MLRRVETRPTYRHGACSLNIKKLEIFGFKSIDHLILEDVSPFSVFAGSNGAGKSNIADALAFFGRVVAVGAVEAMRELGGFSYIHCFGRDEDDKATIGFAIDIELKGEFHQYELTIFSADSKPLLQELMSINGVVYFDIKPNMRVRHREWGHEGVRETSIKLEDKSGLRMFGSYLLELLLTKTRIFRIDPLLAKAPNTYNIDNSELSTDGSNVATILASLEKDEEFVEQVMEWLELIVPSMEKITSETQHLDGSTVLTFHEEGLKKRFPARLVSDGTMYTLCILTAVLSRVKKPGITIIEEPERGIHPKAIGELVNLMRENASVNHPIFLTTHSEAVVRNLKPAELALVDKEDGKTVVHFAKDAGVDESQISLDKAWLSNLFDGGLPW